MDETLWHKFTQHSDLKEELLATGDAELVEVRNCVTDFTHIVNEELPGFG